MKKKRLWLAISALAVIAVLGGVTLADQEVWSKFEKNQGVIHLENGIPIQVAGEKEKHEVVRSIDPITGNPTTTLSELFWDSNSKTRTIGSVINGEHIEFEFRITSDQDENLLFSLPGQNYHLTSIPNITNQYILQYNSNLYLVDSKNSTVDPLLKEEIGKYNIKDLENETLIDFYPEWATSPYIALDGSKIIFHSTRNAVYDGNGNGEMWVKYLPDGEEFPVMEGNYTFIGFGSNEDVYYQREDRIERIHLLTKKSEVVIDFSLYAALQDPYLIYQSEYNKPLDLLDTKTNTVKPLLINGIGVVESIWIYAESPWIIIINQPDRTESLRNLILYNIETGQTKQLDEPQDKSFTYVEWLNNEQFIVSVIKRGTDQEETYVVNLKDVKHQ